MKFSLTPLFLCCLIGSPGELHSQSSDQPPVYTSLLHISTNSGKYKGRIIIPDRGSLLARRIL